MKLATTVISPNLFLRPGQAHIPILIDMIIMIINAWQHSLVNLVFESPTTITFSQNT